MLEVKINETGKTIKTNSIKVTCNGRNWLISDGDVLHLQICDKDWNPTISAD